MKGARKYVRFAGLSKTDNLFPILGKVGYIKQHCHITGLQCGNVFNYV